MLVVVTLLLLHAPDGREIRIAPEHITLLRSAKVEADNKLFTDDVACMISLSDGRYVTVVEPCQVIEKMMERLR